LVSIIHIKELPYTTIIKADYVVKSEIVNHDRKFLC